MAERTHEELSNVALTVATRAAELVMQGFGQSKEVQRKSEDQLVTEYDLRSEELVKTLLADHTPGISVVGEEQGGQESEGLTWFIDPIDGTNNFIAGHPVFAISLGARQGAKPVAGAVVAPALGLRWHGWVGGGAFRNGEPCHVSATSAIQDGIITSGYPQRSGGVSLETYAQVVLPFRDVRRCGCASVELCWVADGTYEAYWSRRLPHWDTAAGAALVLAAGGSWHSDAVHDVATNGLLQRDLEALIYSEHTPKA